MKNKCFYTACVIVLSAISLVGCGEVDTKTSTPAVTKIKQEKPADSKPAVDWNSEIKKIAKGDGTTTEKADNIEKLARDYTPTSDELKAFQTRIVDEFIHGKYLTNKDNAEYMLTNLFQSVVVERQADESQDIKEYAFRFYKNTKYVFRGVDELDSNSVKVNEGKMKKLINRK